jgi:hypothetical protein
MSQALTAQQVALQVLEAIRLSHPQLIADNMPPDWGMNKVREGLTTPRVLVVVKGGVADPVSDPGVDVQVFDWDNYEDDPKEAGGVPGSFADLADPLGIPVEQTVFEITAAGFNGGSDETDDLVIWVSALSPAIVKSAIADTGATFCGPVDGNPIEDADFELPSQAGQLATRLLELASAERNRNRGCFL